MAISATPWFGRRERFWKRKDWRPCRFAASLARRGVSPAAPYHHFPDKQALLDAVAAQGFDALTAAMEKRMAKKTDPTARLDASGVGYVTFALENPALFRLMFGNGEQQPSANARLTRSA